MDSNYVDKSKLPSRHVTEGPERAPHRSYLYAMGLTTEQIHQPLVGVATAWNEAAPCNISLARQAQSVKKGVAAANGTPREFCTITVTDGIAMGHQGMKASRVSREVIADSVELTMRGHCYDALVGLAGCDKSLPGMMMAMVLAVNWPPHAPAPGQAAHSTACSSSSVIFPAAQAPTASNTLCTVSAFPCSSPGMIVPPYRNTLGTFSRAIAISVPGRLLSQPAMATSAS